MPDLGCYMERLTELGEPDKEGPVRREEGNGIPVGVEGPSLDNGRDNVPAGVVAGKGRIVVRDEVGMPMEGGKGAAPESWRWNSNLGPGTAKDIEVARRPGAGHTEHLVAEAEERIGRSRGEVEGMHQDRMAAVEEDREVADSPAAAAAALVVLSGGKRVHVAANCISPCWAAPVVADIE